MATLQPTTDQFKKKKTTADFLDEVKQKRDNFLQSISGQKVDPNDYLMDAPDKPEFNSERFKNAKNLSKVALIAQGIDALMNAVGTATTDNTGSYQAAPSQIAQLGLSAYDDLATMDANYRKKLENYEQSVFDTRQYNKEAKRKAAEFNAGVDSKVAEQELNFALNDAQAQQKAEAQARELANERDIDEKEAYLEAGQRLISQGQERAAMVAYRKAGLSTDEIAAAISGRGGVGGDADPVVASMIDRYRELDKMTSTGGALHFDAQGKPITAQAREMVFLQEELGRELYNPIYKPDKAASGINTGKDLITDLNKQRIQQGLDTEEVVAGLNSPESLASENTGLVQNIRESKSIAEQRKNAAQLIENWKNLGLSDAEIKQNMDRFFGQSSPNIAANRSPKAKKEEKIAPGGGIDNSFNGSFEEYVKTLDVDQIRKGIAELEARGKDISLEEFKRLEQLQGMLPLKVRANNMAPVTSTRTNNPIRPDSTKGIRGVMGNVQENWNNLSEWLHKDAEERYQQYLNNQ